MHWKGQGLAILLGKVPSSHTVPTQSYDGDHKALGFLSLLGEETQKESGT